MLKMMKALVVLISVLTAASALAADAKPAATAETSVTRLTVVTGQASPELEEGVKRRDGLTPKVILQLVKKALKNKEINAAWLGRLDVIYGHFSSATATEALVISRDGKRSHAEGYSHVWLLGLQGGKWSFLKKLAVADELTVVALDLNSDGIDELMINGGGGNGMAYYEAGLYSYKDNKIVTLYSCEGHTNWGQGFHPDYKKNILEKRCDVSFTKPDAAGIRTLVEQQTLMMGRRLVKKLNQRLAPDEQFEKNGYKYVTTRFNLENGKYRAVPGSAVTTRDPVELETVMDKTVRVSEGLSEYETE